MMVDEVTSRYVTTIDEARVVQAQVDPDRDQGNGDGDGRQGQEQEELDILLGRDRIAGDRIRGRHAQHGAQQHSHADDGHAVARSALPGWPAPAGSWPVSG